MTDESHAMTIRLSDARYEQLRRAAYERRESMNAIVDQALSLLTGPRDEGLRGWMLDMAMIKCPECEAEAYPDSLGEAIDWAAGHQCGEEES